jgi:hypothetical protein
MLHIKFNLIVYLWKPDTHINNLAKFNIILLQIKQQWDRIKSYHNLCTVLSLQVIHISSIDISSRAGN